MMLCLQLKKQTLAERMSGKGRGKGRGTYNKAVVSPNTSSISLISISAYSGKTAIITHDTSTIGLVLISFIGGFFEFNHAVGFNLFTALSNAAEGSKTFSYIFSKAHFIFEIICKILVAIDTYVLTPIFNALSYVYSNVLYACNRSLF